MRCAAQKNKENVFIQVFSLRQSAQFKDWKQGISQPGSLKGLRIIVGGFFLL